MGMNVGGAGSEAAFRMEDLQIAQYEPKKAGHGIIGSPGQANKDGASQGMHLTAHDSMASATHDSIRIAVLSDLNASLQFPPGDIEQLPQQILDNADPRNPTITPLTALINMDRRGGMQAQMQALNKGVDPGRVKDEAFEKAMSKYDPPLSAAQTALVMQHKQAYFKDANDPTIPENVKEIMDDLTKESAHEISKKFGISEDSLTKAPEKDAPEKTQAAKEGDEGKPEDIDLNAPDPKVDKKAGATETDPAKIASQAFSKAIENHEPPLTQDQKNLIMQFIQDANDPKVPEEVKAIAQQLMATAAADVQEQMATSKQTVATGLEEGSSAATGAKKAKAAKAASKVTPTTSSLGDVRGGQLTTASSGNAWESGTAYLAFELAFLTLVRLMMRTKMVETNVQMVAQGMQYAMAQNTAGMMITEADTQRSQYMTEAITSGISLSASLTSGVIGMGGTDQEEQPVSSNNAPATKMEEMEELPEEGKTTNVYGHTKEQVETNNAQIKLANKNIQERNGVISNRNDTIKKNDDHITLQKGYLASGSAADEDVTQSDINNRVTTNRELIESTQKDAAQNEAEKLSITKLKEDPNTEVNPTADKLTKDQIKEYNTKQVAAGNKEADSINAKVKSTNEAIKAKNAGIASRNANMRQTRHSASQFLDNTFQNLTKMTNSSVQAAYAVQLGYLKGQEAIVQTVGSLQGTLASSAGDAFRANSDLLSQTINMLDSIRQKLIDAVAAMLRGKS